MGERIIDYPEAETLANDDYVLLDGITNGSKKILASELGGGGGGIEIKEIYNNTTGEITQYQLTESVYNFDFIIFVGLWNLGGNQITATNITPSSFLTIRTDAMANWNYIQLHCVENWTLFAMNNPSSSGGVGDKIDYIRDNGSRGILTKVYGVKLSTT